MPRFPAFAVLMFSLSVAQAAAPLPDSRSAVVADVSLRTAESVGRTMYRHDRAASVATDALLKLPAFGKESRAVGWVTEERGGQIMVTFIDKTPAALYRIPVSATDLVAGPVETLAKPEALTEYEAGAAAARSAALSVPFRGCAARYNSVVLPSAGMPRTWAVYLLPAATVKNVLPFGGAYRIDTDGARVIAQRSFTRSCLDLETSEDAAGLTVSHLLDPAPTEVHVFWSLWAGLPMYVGIPANDTLWAVENGIIKPMTPDTAKR